MAPPNMFAFLTSAVRIVLRRLLDDWLMLGVLAFTVIAAMVQLAAAPIYQDAVTVGALRQILADAPAAESSVHISVRTAPETYNDVNALVTSAASEASGGVEAQFHRRVQSASNFVVPSSADDQRETLTMFTALSGIDRHAELLDGTWQPVLEPDDADAGRVVAVAMHARAAAELDLAVGDRIELEPTRPSSGAANRPTVELAAIYTVPDPDDAFWAGDPLLTNAVRLSPSFRTVGPMVVSLETIAGLSSVNRFSASWVLEPDFAQITVTDVDRLKRPIAALEDQLVDELTTSDSSITSVTSAPEVDTGLPELLAITNQALAVTRSGVYAVVGQLAILAALAIGIGAALLVEVRRQGIAVLQARGAGRGHLAGLAVLEAMVLVGPTAVAAPFLAVALINRLRRTGLLEGFADQVEPAVNSSAVAAVATAAVAAVLLLAWPAIRSARQSVDTATSHRRRRLRQATDRAGVDIALLVLTIVAFWQLTALQDGEISRIAGSGGVDPVLVVTPALALAAGAVLTLRIVPLTARIGERAVHRTRSIIAALTGWEHSRRPGSQARTAFLLVMALSLGFFAATYTATWDASQFDQAEHQTGADVRTLPNRQVGASIVDFHLLNAHENVDGIAGSMPVVRHGAPLPGSSALGAFLLLDASRAADIIEQRDDEANLRELLDLLHLPRPEVPGLDLPGTPTRIEFTLQIDEKPIPAPPSPRGAESGGSEVAQSEEGDDAEASDDETPVEDDEPEYLPPGFSAAVHVVVQDVNGLLHRFDAGWLEAGVEEQLFTIELNSANAGNTATLRPAFPLRIVDLELRAPAPASRSREVTVEVPNLIVVDDEGSTAVSLRFDASGGEHVWTGSTSITARTAEVPEISVVTTDGGLRLELATAARAGPTQPVVLFSVRPGVWRLPETVPTIASTAWLAESSTAVGDQLHFENLPFGHDEAVVVGAVDLFPTIDPTTERAVIMDLATVQLHDYQTGRPLISADEYWLDVADSADPDHIATLLTEPPFDSVEVIGRDATYRRFTADPAALATIGAYTVGFMAAAVFAIVVFVATTTVSARERRNEFTLLRAFGLTPRQFVRWAAVERLLLVAVGAVLGVGLGFVLSASVLPLIAVGRQGAVAVPEVEVHYPWPTIAAVVATPIVALATVVLLIALRPERESLGSRIRDGER